MTIYLQPGADHLVPLSAVIAVLDGRLRRQGSVQEFLDLQRSAGRLVDLAGGRPRALVITDQATYLSPLSPAALRRRVWSRQAPGARPAGGDAERYTGDGRRRTRAG
ncbi:MAG: DUF370 domain-containing protein [Thermaerobacter sp.]|nr:hypothetical protein [Bacillota bacterium]